MNKEIYINGMDWKRIKDNQGELTLMITFKDYFSKEDYIELIKRNYYFLTTKEEFEHLKMQVECLTSKDKPKDKMIEKLALKNKQLQERIDEAKDLINNACPWLNIDLRDDDEILQVKAKLFKKILQILQGEDNESNN